MMHNGDRADQPLASLSCRHPASRTRTSLTAKHLIIIHHPSYLHLIHPTTSTTYYHPSLSPLLSSSHPEISTTKLPSTMEALYRMSESTASASRSAATQVGGHGGVMSDASGSIVMKVSSSVSRRAARRAAYILALLIIDMLQRRLPFSQRPRERLPFINSWPRHLHLTVHLPRPKQPNKLPHHPRARAPSPTPHLLRPNTIDYLNDNSSASLNGFYPDSMGR
jgi:hypothetical protein